MKRRLATVALIAIAVMGSAGAPSPASALTSAEARFVSLTNSERSERGRRTLAVRSDLASVARRHSAGMAADGTIYHNRHLASEVSGWWTLGENVGMGPSVDSLHQAFMSSAGHRANILDRDFNQIGVGVVIRDDTLYVTKVFAGRRSARTARLVSRRVSRTTPGPIRKKRPPAPVEAPARTIVILLRLTGLDAKRVDPTTGKALGL